MKKIFAIGLLSLFLVAVSMHATRAELVKFHKTEQTIKKDDSNKSFDFVAILPESVSIQDVVLLPVAYGYTMPISRDVAQPQSRCRGPTTSGINI